MGAVRNLRQPPTQLRSLPLMKSFDSWVQSNKGTKTVIEFRETEAKFRTYEKIVLPFSTRFFAGDFGTFQSVLISSLLGPVKGQRTASTKTSSAEFLAQESYSFVHAFQ